MKKICIIHQMGKVGSTTIYKNLKNFGLEVYHTHFLNNKTLQNQLNKANGDRILEHLQSSIKINQMLDAGDLNDVDVKIITLVREPIIRNISAYFQNISNYRENLNVLINDFLENYPHKLPLNWLDQEVRDVFGIDVYDVSFSHSNHYLLAGSNNITLLLLRLEDLSRIINSNIIQTFLDEPDLKFTNSYNKAESKEYNAVYKEFISKIMLPDSYVSGMLNSKYCKHFYTDVELDEFYKRYQLEA